jgi:hypothetical protein
MTEKPIMNSSTTTNDDLDAAKVPCRTAYTGARIPAIGLGLSARIDFPVKQLPKL